MCELGLSRDGGRKDSTVKTRRKMNEKKHKGSLCDGDHQEVKLLP